jgi:hypothetical protein
LDGKVSVPTALLANLEWAVPVAGSTSTVIVVAVPMRTPVTPAKRPVPPVKV